jgi:cytochrome c oxidase cbb3-type subunit 3
MNQLKSKIFALLGAIVLPYTLIAQDAKTPVPAAAAETSFWEIAFGNITLAVGGVVILGALYAVVKLFDAMARMEELKLLKEKGIEEIIETYKQPQTSLWTRLTKAMTRSVPLEQEADIMLDHNYDGIKELDNRLPPWWLWMFYVTVIFSVIYMGYYHVGGGPKLTDEYITDIAKAEAAVTAFKEAQSELVNENNVVKLTSPADLEAGKVIFTTNCIACHGSNGEGNTIGPNLTDDYWIHGGDIKNLFGVILNGVVEKGMQSWKSVLRPKDMQAVASYVLSLQGSNPPNAKAPQGELWEPSAEAPNSNAEQNATPTNQDTVKAQ